jgi:hypothetical protein
MTSAVVGLLAQPATVIRHKLIADTKTYFDVFIIAISPPYSLFELKLRYYFATMGRLLAHATRSGSGFSEKNEEMGLGKMGSV